MTNYIREYYEKINSGEITVGKFILQIYSLILVWIEKSEVFYDEKKAHRAIKYIENFCYHSEGKTGLLKLELWQKAAVSLIFGILDENGLRQFREVIIVIGRKNGKTLFASAIISYMAFLDGEQGAKIYCLAPKLEQANIVYDGFYQMLLKEPELSTMAKKRRSDIYIPETNTAIKPIAFNAKKSDGFNPHLVVCDEIASWQGDGGLKQYEVMASALGARKQPLILSISTAGYINDSIYDEHIKRASAVLNGSSNEKRLLPLLYIIDDESKWNDMDELKKSNPNLNVSVSEDFLREEIAKAELSFSKLTEFKTKYCNIKQNSVMAWLGTKTINKIDCEAPLKLENFKNSYAVGGIDLSQTTDLTCACVLIEKKGVIYCFAKFFMPANKIRQMQERDGVPYEIFQKRGFLSPSGENFVDYKDVFNWYIELIKKYEIRCLKIGYDRYSAQYLIQDLKNFGFHTDDVFQGENLTPVIKEFEGIIEDGNFKCDNPLMKSHFLNVAMKENSETRKIRPVKIEQRSRIDGTVAVFDAMTVRQKYFQEIGAFLKNA